VKIIAVYNIKGGVGKTTTSVNLACFLARAGLSVLLWDLDPQGGSSYFFNKQNQNSNTHGRLFDKYITIYDIIHPTEKYEIDLISNDPVFSDMFINKASKIASINFDHHVLLSETLKEVEDDYDVCIMDCSPGRFIIHDNIFNTADLLLIPNIPAPLSLYCNNMLMDALEKEQFPCRVLSFYNMVQVHKSLHKQYLDERPEGGGRLLNNYIPFYADIELITHTRESIFHQLKESRAAGFYHTLWIEICERMGWMMINEKGKVVDLHEGQVNGCSLVRMEQRTELLKYTS